MEELTAQNVGTRSSSSWYRGWFLLILVLIYASSFVDRIIVAVVGQAVKMDMGLSDYRVGLLGGLAFSIFYSVLGLPIARLADKFNRVVLISVSIVAWSAMTALCGTAGSFWQLMLYRLGVGIGEAGSTPTSHSLIADEFGPRRRASALAVYALGPPIGVLAGAFGGGWLVEHLGWRPVFFVVGLPGLVFGLLAWLTLREPKRGGADGVAAGSSASAPPLSVVFKRLTSSRAFVQMLLGTVIGAFGQYGINLFIPMYFIRVYSMSFAQAGVIFGLVLGVGGIIGTTLGGVCADRVGVNDRRWYARIPALGTGLGFPLLALAFIADQWQLSVALLFMGTILLNVWNGPTFAVVQSIVEPRMRATASAIVFLLMNLIGQGLGTPTVGFLSDRFASHLFTQGDFHAVCTVPKGPHGAAAVLQGPFASACHDASANGVRYAMLTASVVLIWSAFHYLRATRHLKKNS
ncbi:spinster family MFS transporter [Paraburkholderia youngii]|uniref:Putative MFS family arabinose efflux permease n=1 Tax=Paraburkholderia youngii TaxID=2782701 RepID=A0A7W8L8B4_9BURK|nr:MFS transporter [Paraburkholderia youngii]MBB5402352.1 putative MFS family arabinose efflux permease [Paraburkholderia youngii]